MLEILYIVINSKQRARMFLERQLEAGSSRVKVTGPALQECGKNSNPQADFLRGRWSN